MKTIIVQVSPSVESWGTFKKCCIEKGWVYQTLYNDGLAPKIGKPAKIKDCELHRIFVK